MSNQENLSHRNYIKELSQKGVEHFIPNIKTTFSGCDIEGHPFAKTVNFKEFDTSYVTSIYTAVISYSREELKKIDNRAIRLLLKMTIYCLDSLLKVAKIDQIVAYNNYLLSTNLYPEMTGEELEALTQEHRKNYPHHALLFRSLNLFQNKDLCQTFIKLGYKLIPSRQVYLFDLSLKDYTKTHNYKIDQKIVAKKDYKVVLHHEFQDDDFERMADLYKDLYIEKYSSYNPLFNKNYIEMTHKTRFLYYMGLRNSEGVLDGVIGCYDRGPSTSAPVVGYDRSLPIEKGLYRRLLHLCMKRALSNKKILNFSSGASHFKRLRGGLPYTEYSAVYYKHLPSYKQKIVWFFLNILLTYMAMPIIKKFKL